MTLKRRGSNVERELQKYFWKYGWACARVAGSGSSSYPSPDLIAGKNGRIYAIEVKSTRNDKIYLRDEQIQELLTFSEKLGAVPLIAIKFIGNGWYFFHVRNLKSNKITLELAKKEGIPKEEFFKD